MTTTTDVYNYTYFSALKCVIKRAIVYLGAPYLFLSFLAFMFATNHISSSARAYSGSLKACLLSFIGLVIIMMLTAYVLRFNKRNYNALRDAFTLEDRFEPQMELHNASYSQYLGLDTKNGTVVLFCNINNKEHLTSRDTLVVGFTNYSWHKCELHGNKIVFFTHDPMIPAISFKHRRAPLLFERLSAMQRLDFSYDVNFPGWVNFQAKQVAEELNLNLITVKS